MHLYPASNTHLYYTKAHSTNGYSFFCHANILVGIKVDTVLFMSQALERDKVIMRFHQMTVKIEAALSIIPYKNFDMSEEVCEQVLWFCNYKKERSPSVSTSK